MVAAGGCCDFCLQAGQPWGPVGPCAFHQAAEDPIVEELDGPFGREPDERGTFTKAIGRALPPQLTWPTPSADPTNEQEAETRSQPRVNPAPNMSVDPNRGRKSLARGLQALNVARGGTLHQHLPDRPGTTIDHRQAAAGDKVTHSVEITPGSLLHTVMRRRRARVNSFHHQAINRLGAGLRAVFGMGRSGRSKALPWGLLVLALSPAVIAVAIRVLAGDILELYSYENYLWEIGGLLPENLQDGLKNTDPGGAESESVPPDLANEAGPERAPVEAAALGAPRTFAPSRRETPPRSRSPRRTSGPPQADP